MTSSLCWLTLANTGKLHIAVKWTLLSQVGDCIIVLYLGNVSVIQQRFHILTLSKVPQNSVGTGPLESIYHWRQKCAFGLYKLT